MTVPTSETSENLETMNVKKAIHDLVCKYELNREFYRSEQYNETMLRRDFLDPLFVILGWDIENKKGAPMYEREVILEESLKNGHSSHSKRPDYTFRLYSERKYFLEAKKPYVDIKQEPEPAKQIRRYGFTAGLKIGVLCNFEYLCIYETTIPVDEDDNQNKCLIKCYHYSEYEKAAEELLAKLGQKSVYSKQFETVWENIAQNVEHQTIDQYFLEQINEWRLTLGNEIYANHPEIDINMLGDIVQSYINSILFLRVCEDRNIEDYESLLHIANQHDFKKLINKFKGADKKYNSGLFSNKYINQQISDKESALWSIIRQLYYPESPYSFSVFSSDVLGRIYEIFLTKKLALENGRLIITKKAAWQARDVVATPNAIIRAILTKCIDWKDPSLSGDRLFAKKFADIACGSGSFLIELFQQLCDYLTDYYLLNSPSKVIKTAVNTYKLKYQEKIKLLCSCIHGVDQDYNAVQASKFGLLLKLLEGESSSTLEQFNPILPSLDNNIHYGNSLIDSSMVDNSTGNHIVPFDFYEKYDYIIGNPPYMKTSDMRKFSKEEFQIFKNNYDTAYRQFDKYFLFIEKGLELLKEGGRLGFIVPNKFMKVGAAQNLRELITKHHYVEHITSFGANQIFSDKSTYTSLLILSKKDNKYLTYTEVDDYDSWRIHKKIDWMETRFPVDHLSGETWVLYPEQYRKLFEEKILPNSIKLGELLNEHSIFNGIQTSADKEYVIKPITYSKQEKIYRFKYQGEVYAVEQSATKPYFQTPESNAEDGLSTYSYLKENARVIYPYKNVNNQVVLLTLSEIQKDYPALYAYLTTDAVKNKLLDRRMKPDIPEKDKWYRYGRQQSLSACEIDTKLVVGVLSKADKYAIDTNRTLVSSGGTAGYCMISIPDDCNYSIYYIQALLSSKQGEWVASLYGEIFRGGFIARGTKVLKQLPIARIDFTDSRQVDIHDDIVVRQKQLIDLGEEIANSSNNLRKLVPLKRRFECVRAMQQSAINRLFSMSDAEADTIPNIPGKYGSN